MVIALDIDDVDASKQGKALLIRIVSILIKRCQIRSRARS